MNVTLLFAIFQTSPYLPVELAKAWRV